MIVIKTIGTISQKIISAFNLPCPANTPIMIGDTNIDHMKDTHPIDYHRYGPHIEEIILSPDYVGLDPKNNSVDYVKEFVINGNEYVMVAVRVSNSGKYFARSLFVTDKGKIDRFLAKGTLKKFDDL